MFVIGMAIVPSVTACSNTPQSASWGYNFIVSDTIEDYGDFNSYLASACSIGGSAAIGCAVLSETVVGAAICAGVVAGIPCVISGVVNWDYTSKNSWLRNNCAQHDKKLIDTYGPHWWLPIWYKGVFYTNARCGC